MSNWTLWSSFLSDPLNTVITDRLTNRAAFMKSLQSSDHQPPKTKTKYPTRPPKGIQTSDRTTPPDRLNLRPNRPS